ncbi:hypothetical protein H4R19_007213 [Coemansia spiralis]|nr:hypothetical protein H4R19_007213 [Coemansia spiralis]
MVDGGYGQSPLGFVMPAPHNCAHGPAAAAGSMYSMAPPRPMGEPGGFVVSGSQYPPPPHQQQQEPLSPAFSATSFASSAQQYPYASHAVEPQSFHASGRHPSSIGSMASLPLTGHPGPRDVVSRQGSLRSWLSGASQRSGASETVVGSQMRPKHLHRQHHPPRPESGATFRPNDA